jgi:ABC-type multidrug transport system permease subunit
MNEAVTITPLIQWLIDIAPGLIIASIPIILLILFIAWILYYYPPPFIGRRI